MSQEFEPIACSLPLREAASQAGEWHELHGCALSVEEVEQGISVVYPIELATQVEHLVAREAACCEWLSLDTQIEGRGIRVQLTSANPEARQVIEALVGV